MKKVSNLSCLTVTEQEFSDWWFSKTNRLSEKDYIADYENKIGPFEYDYGQYQRDACAYELQSNTKIVFRDFVNYIENYENENFIQNRPENHGVNEKNWYNVSKPFHLYGVKCEYLMKMIKLKYPELKFQIINGTKSIDLSHIKLNELCA